MRLPGTLGHLTYCLNIHPAEDWPACRAALTGPVANIKRAVAPDLTFDVGLRFSAMALDALEEPKARQDLKDVLEAHDYRAITVNGFPYGPFHGERVKEDVYQPDWRTQERLAYTTGLIALMAEIGPATGPISLSTVPGTFKPLGKGAEDEMADRMLRAAAFAIQMHQDTGRTVALAIEPEPFCFLETISETADFFEHYLFNEEAVSKIAAWTGLAAGDAASALPRHIGLCYDVCHAAVEFEDPAESLATLRSAGIPVHKLQLSAALQVPQVDAAAREALATFAEPTYLHQVVSRRGDDLAYMSDLPEALNRTDSDGEEWRIHFHVPVFVEDIPPFKSTQNFLREILALHKQDPISEHLEVETYTWGVLPDAMRAERIEDDIVRELTWVQEQLS